LQKAIGGQTLGFNYYYLRSQSTLASIAGVPGVIGVPAIAFVSAVVGISAVTGVPVVAIIFAVASVPFDPCGVLCTVCIVQ
jgi:hypothetical protein